jgi:hypothetical protein
LPKPQRKGDAVLTFAVSGSGSDLRPLRHTCGKLALLIVCILFLAPRFVQAQANGAAANEAVTTTRATPPDEPVESEIVYEGLDSYGNYKIFAAGWDMKLWKGGIEYDRHSWGYFLGARMDYVGEIVPFLLLYKPTYETVWGNPAPGALAKPRSYVYGGGIAPIGFRMMWRDRKAIKPYLLAKGGIIAFQQKVPCSECTYENFSLESEMGMQVRMSPKVDLRLGLFGDYHFSNAFMVQWNPGLDVMNASIGLSYHLGRPAPAAH